MKFFAISAIGFVFLVTLFSAVPAQAQTAATGAVLGTVTDPQQAAVEGATVELRNIGTNEVRAQTTNSAGQYSVPGVTPGMYKISVTRTGFRSHTLDNFRVDVNKSYTLDFKLELGQASEVVRVESTLQAELQTTDAQIGNDVSSSEIMNLSTLRRNAAALLTLQPGVSPGNGSFPRVGMRVAGAIDDQNVFTLDGIDVSDNVIGGIDAQTIATIPLGAESVEEYRVGVNNPNATFGRASGGQIAVISKTGTNNFHGAGYWFHQNSALNANQWELNHTFNPKSGQSFTPIPKQHDNRFGARLGGPIWHDKTFFFFDYEGRRFPQQTTFNRLMPTTRSYLINTLKALND